MFKSDASKPEYRSHSLNNLEPFKFNNVNFEQNQQKFNNPVHIEGTGGAAMGGGGGEGRKSKNIIDKYNNRPSQNRSCS